jgi:DNA-binding beta-propeller fold protein YncE
MDARSLPGVILLLLVLTISACGGVSSSMPPPPPPPPPPAADFALSATSPTVTIQQGGAQQFQTIQANPVNGFTGSIKLTITGLPAGAITMPSGPLSIFISGPQVQVNAFQLAASQTTPIGSTTVSVTGTSGTITHTASFSLTVTQGAPFRIQASPSSVALTPSSIATIQISVTANPGTSPQLGVNVTGPPNSSQVMTGIPQGFLTPTNPLSFTMTATELAQPLLNYPIVVTASDNSSSNTAMVIVPLTVTVPYSSNTTPTRSTFFRTDRAPTGMAYDPIRKLLFVSVEILNEVEVVSSVDGHQVASIPVNFPAGIDEAADGSAVYVVSPYFGGVTIIDPNLLQVVAHASVPQSVSGLPVPVVFLQIASLSNGKVVLSPALDSIDLAKPPFYLWDPKADTFSRFGPVSFVSQSILMSRSADHSKLVANGAAAGGILYDANTDTFVGPTPLISGVSAINSNGSQLVSAGYQNSSAVLDFYDNSFSLLGSLPFNSFWSSGPPPDLFYSLDGRHLYVVPNQGNGVGNSGAVVAVIDTKTFSVVGLVPCFSFGAALPFSGQWITTFAIDETNMLFGAAFGGVGFLDMSSPTSLQEPLPGPFIVQPSLASLSTTSTAQLNGVGFTQDATFDLFVGLPPASLQSLKATNISVQSTNFLNLTIPKGTAAGPANATLTRSDGFFEVMPDAVTFGPTVLRVDADAGSPSGNDPIQIAGYGFDSPNTQVTIGGRTATIVQTVSAISGQLFPTESIVLKTPPGTPGMADVTVSTPAGNTTIPGGFQYLNSVQVYPTPGALDAIIYDKSRQRLYISNQDHNRVEIFDLGTNKFLPPISVGNAPTSLALTPDGQLLAVMNSIDGTASVINPATMLVSATFPLLTAADLDKQGCGGVVSQVSPAVPHRMVVSVVCTSVLLGGNSHLINLDSGSLSCVGVAGCNSNGTDLSPFLAGAVLASTPDGTRVFFTAGDVGLLDLTANTLTESNAASYYYDAAISADGNTFAAAFGTYDANLARISIMAFEPFADSGSQSLNNVIGEKLNPSGSLLFFPQKSGVDLFDVRTGRLVRHVVLPDPLPLDMNGMALDETGTKMFLISNTGVTVAQLYQLPLSLATLSPATGPSGTTVTLRGSGFQSGATVSFGTVQVSSTLVDSNTLQAVVPTLLAGPVRVSIKNPDGHQYSLDDAYILQ